MNAKHESMLDEAIDLMHAIVKDNNFTALNRVSAAKTLAALLATRYARPLPMTQYRTPLPDE